MKRDWKALVVVAAGGSAALLMGAYIFQALGYAPCKLCWWQRYPHFAAVAIGLLALVLRKQKLAWAGALAALVTAGLGIYHTGVERGFWLGPSTCSSTGVEGVSADDLLNQIMNAPLIRCNEVAWSLFDLSMASWNAILSFVLVLIWVNAARRRNPV